MSSNSNNLFSAHLKITISFKNTFTLFLILNVNLSYLVLQPDLTKIDFCRRNYLVHCQLHCQLIEFNLLTLAVFSNVLKFYDHIP